jgi:hypothetical protein
MSSPSSPTLTYLPNDRPPRHLVYRETDTTCRLTFPPPPAWLGWTGIASSLAGTAAQLAILWMLARHLMWRSSFNATLPPGTPPFPVWSSAVILPLLVLIHYALLWTGAAATQYRTLRRQQRIPRFLELGPSGLTYQDPTLFRHRRHRHWPTPDVLAIDIKPVRSILPRHRVIRLAIKVRPGRPLRFQFAGPDKIALAEQFAARSREILTPAQSLPPNPSFG